MPGGFIYKVAPITAETFTTDSEWIANNCQFGDSTNTTHHVACRILLKLTVNLIIDTDTGWILDADKNPTIDDVIHGENNAGYPVEYLCLKNTVNGAKLMVVYKSVKDSSTSASTLPFYSNTSVRYFSRNRTSTIYEYFSSYSSSIMYSGRLMMSIIPAGSSSTFGTTSNNWLPIDATPFVSLSWPLDSNSPGASIAGSAAYSSDFLVKLSNHKYEYCVGSHNTEPVITMCLKRAPGTADSVYGLILLGHLFKKTLDTENLPQNEYGAMTFGGSNSSNTWYANFGDSYNALGAIQTNSSVGFYNGDLSVAIKPSFYVKNRWMTGSWKDSTTTEASAVYSAHCCMIDSAAGNNYQRYFCDYRNFLPLAPLVCYTHCDEFSGRNYFYVGTPGNGLKGIINTDILAITIADGNQYVTRGTLLDNGNYIYMGGGIVLGWDPSNPAEVNPYYVRW